MIRLFRKKKQNVNLIDALKRCADANLVEHLRSNVETTDLVEAVALNLAIDPELLLAEVAKCLALKPQISIPSNQTPINNYSHEALRARTIFAISNDFAKDRCSFIVADPSLIAADEFIATGHDIRLALGSKIRQAWDEHDAHNRVKENYLSEKAVFQALTAMASHAQTHKATAIVIENRNCPTYSFNTRDQSYSGTIDSLLFNAIDYYCPHQESLNNLDISENEVTVSVERIKHSNSPSFKLSWESSNIDRPKMEFSSVAPTIERSPHIVIVDDEHRFASLLKHILVSKGYTVTTYTNGDQALSAIRNNEITKESILICDVHMPEMDGPTLVQYLRVENYNNPVIMLTSETDDLLESELILLGINAFVRKQANPRVLLAWIHNICKREQANILPINANSEINKNQRVNGIY